MNRSSWLHAYKHLDSLPKRRRYSLLSEPELRALWNEVGVMISAHMLNKKVCVSVPYVGRFVIGHPSPSGVDADPASYAAHFIPAQNFTKIPGLHGTRCNLINVAPTEPLNYSAIASTTAFTRDDVELGIKDIALGMFRVVKERDSAVFPLPGIGKIIFWHGQVRLKYDAAFCAAMNAPPPPPESAQEHSPTTAVSAEPSYPDDSQKQGAPEPPTGRLKKEAPDTVHALLNWQSSPVAPNRARPAAPAPDVTWPSLKVVPGDSSQAAAAAAALPADETTEGHRFAPWPTNDACSGAAQQADPESADPLLERLKQTILASEVTLPFIQVEVEHARKKAAVTRARPSSLIEPPDGTHLHSNSGNRLWRDDKCPVCRAKARQFDDMREDAKNKEKVFDRMIVRLSTEIDQQLTIKEKAAEDAKAKNCAATAQYNWKTILQKEDEKKAAAKAALEERIKYPKPQPRPREWDQQLAADLKKQIDYRRRKADTDQRTAELEAKLSNQLAAKVLKDAQFKEHLDDLRRKQLQSTALWWQVQAQKKREDRSRRVNDMPFDNAFVADDGDRKAPAAEMAKQLLDEQIRVIRVKRENERQEKKRQLLLSKKLLDTTQNELRRDLQMMRREKWEARKTLETFWRDQNFWKQQLATVYRD